MLVPAAVILALISANFLYIPHGNGQRFRFLLIVLLIQVVFLGMLAFLIPPSREVPLIAILFLIYCVSHTVMSAIVIMLEKTIRDWEM